MIVASPITGSAASMAKSMSARRSNVGAVLIYARSATVNVTNSDWSETTSRKEVACVTHGGASSGGIQRMAEKVDRCERMGRTRQIGAQGRRDAGTRDLLGESSAGADVDFSWARRLEQLRQPHGDVGERDVCLGLGLQVGGEQPAGAPEQPRDPQEPQRTAILKLP